MKTHEQDSFDGGRAASISTNPSATAPELEAGRRAPQRTRRREQEQREQDSDQDARALAAAILCLTEGGDLSGD